MTYAKLIGSVVLLIAAFFSGWKVNGWRYETQIAAMQKSAAIAQTTQTEKYRKLETTSQEKTDDLALAQAKLEQQQQAQASSIQQAVSDYAASHHPAAATSTCHSLDADWVRIHDAAASGAPATTNSASRSTTATPATALAVVTDNYAIANTCERRLKGWQDWWEQVAPVANR